MKIMILLIQGISFVFKIEMQTVHNAYWCLQEYGRLSKYV